MPYETHWEPQGIRWAYTGTMSDDDVLRSNLELYQDPRFGSIRYQIADLTHVDVFAASADTIRKLSHMDRDQAVTNPNVKVAIVASTPITLGMANIYTLAAGEMLWQVRVFETEADARAWLGA